MAFIGTPLDTRNTFQSLAGKRFSGDGSTTAFTLDVAPSSTLDIEVFVGNVRQDPNSAYTLSGTTLTFTGAPPSGTNNIYVVHQAKSVGTINPGANSVGVTELNLSDGSDGQAITTDGSGTLSFSSVGVSGISSSADATAITIDSGERVGINSSNMSSLDADANQLVVGSGSGDNGLTVYSDGSSSGSIFFANGTSGTQTKQGQIVYEQNNSAMIFKTGATERFRVTSDGIAIGGTGSANSLDDYEEGVFNISSSQASNFLTGFYTKIGRMVWFTCAGTIPSSGNSATQTLTGLPFTVKDQTADLGGDATGSDSAIGIVGHHSDSGAIAVKFVLDNNATTAKLYQSDNSVATHATFSGDVFNLAGFYTTDS